MKVRYLFFLLVDQGSQRLILGLLSIKEVLDFSLSGVRVKCRLGHQVEMVFKFVKDASIKTTLAGQDNTIS